MMPPSALVPELDVVELVPALWKFCSELVTKDLMAALADATSDAFLFVSVCDLVAAKFVNNFVYAVLRLACTPGVVPDAVPRVLNTWLLVDCSTSVVNVETADATELDVVCVGAFVVMLADSWVGAFVRALADSCVGALVADRDVAAAYRSVRFEAAETAEVELISIKRAAQWLTIQLYRQPPAKL